MSSIPAPAATPSILTPDEQAHRRLVWVSTVDHKKIGILYLFFSLVFFVVGGIEALLMRIQLAAPNNHFLPPDFFNALFTMHGTTMIFLVVMPASFGLINYVLPLQIGARDMAFPRLNAMSVWLVLFGGALLYFVVFTGPPLTGWFAYAPLSETPYNSTLGVDYWIMALLALGIGSIGTGINFIVTVLCLRAPGMSLSRVPLFVWINFVNAFIVILALPVLNAGLIMLFLDREMGTHFFLARGGGSTLLWQHIFWGFGHPEVYILALPAFAIASEVIPVFARKPIFGYGFVAASSVAIAILSFGVWAHHMFTVGMGRAADTFFMIASMLIAIPTGVKVLNWSATLVGGRIRFTVPMLYCIAFIIQFTIGGLSGVTHAETALDWQTKNSYYLIAHFHYVAVGGIFFALLAGLHYWFPKMTGRLMDERLGKWTFWMLVLGFNATFAIQHVLGFMGMPRRVYTYPDFPGWHWMNLLSTIGACIMGVASLMLVYNIFWSLRRGRIAGDDPWDAWTLEWATTSPPPQHNFEALPPVRSRRPLWDLKHPDRADPPVGGADVPAPDHTKAAVWVLIASEAGFFGVLILTFIFFNVRPPAGPNSRNSLEFYKMIFFSLCLFSSSFTLWRSEVAEDRRQRLRMAGWLAATIALGLAFLFGEGSEYAALIHHGVTLNTNLFASTFFILTGFHGFHVCAGLVALAVVMGLGLSGELERHGASPLRAIGLYWHFVDVVWVFVFSTVYVMPHFL